MSYPKNNVDLDSYDKLSTNMFDSKLNLGDSQTPELPVYRNIAP